MTITADRDGGQRQRRLCRPRQAQGNQHAEHSSAYTQHTTDSHGHRATELSDAPGSQGSAVCLSVAEPGNLSFKPGFHLGLAGQKVGCNQAKEGVKEGVRAILAGVA